MTDNSAVPPVARRTDVSHTLHGVTRPDPYAWMRDVGSAEVLGHLRAERGFYDVSVQHLASDTQALRAAIVARIPPSERTVAVDRQRFGYYTERAEGRENGEIRRYPRLASGEPNVDLSTDDELVLDIDALQQGSAYVDVGVCELSPDESLLAYSVDLTGDELFELRFRDLSTGTDRPDRVRRSYYTGAWSSAGTHFFYTVHDEAYRPFEVRRHEMGTEESADVAVFTEDDEQYDVSVRSCRSGGLIVITTASRDTTEEWLVDPADPTAAPRCVEPRRKGREYAVEHAPYDATDRIAIVTNDGASEFRLVTAPTASPGLAHWESVLPPDDAERLSDVDAFEGFLVLTLRREGLPRLRVLRHDGTVVRELDPPQAGHLELGENPIWESSSVVVSRGSYIEPQVWSDVDLATGTETVRHRADVPSYDSSRYETSVVEVPARDGTQLPVTLVRRHDVPLNGTAPCLMYGYGAYEVVFEPELDAGLLAFLDRGVVFAHAQVRGGGELGRRWWLDGSLESKHHTFDDHIDIADALAERYVDGSRISTRGLSAGGLLQAAVFSQRPERWRAVVAEVPFVDVVTTMLDPSIPLTAGEWDEWGDPRREADFGWMLAYSPYDNIPPAGQRPDLLVTGAVHDPRVMVWEPAKWVAALRHSDPGWSPRCQFRVDTGAGAHSGPSGRYAKAAYAAEVYAWLLERLT